MSYGSFRKRADFSNLERRPARMPVYSAGIEEESRGRESGRHAGGRAARRGSLIDLGRPVDDDVERKLVGDDLRDDGEKPIAVRRYIKVCPSLPVDREKRSWSSEHERRGSLYGHRHHALVGREIEKLPAVAAPAQTLGSSSGDTDPLPRPGIGRHVNLRLAGLAGDHREVAAVG